MISSRSLDRVSPLDYFSSEILAMAKWQTFLQLELELELIQNTNLIYDMNFPTHSGVGHSEVP